MPNRQRYLGINIRVTPQEKKKIERNAKKCRLTVSEYLRQLAMTKEPKELPSAEMVESLIRLNDVITAFEKNAEAATADDSRRFYKSCAEYIRKIMTETLQLMTHSGPVPEEKNYGND
jgi:hypothetical protein